MQSTVVVRFGMDAVVATVIGPSYDGVTTNLYETPLATWPSVSKLDASQSHRGFGILTNTMTCIMSTLSTQSATSPSPKGPVLTNSSPGANLRLGAEDICKLSLALVSARHILVSFVPIGPEKGWAHTPIGHLG